jgi:hypothetical protein
MAGKSNGPRPDKLRYDLIPPDALEALAEVYTIGSKKYGDNDYLRGMEWSRIYGAMMRHLQLFWQGEKYDAEGFHHMAAVAWGALTLFVYSSRDLEEDDRSWCPLEVMPGLPDKEDMREWVDANLTKWENFEEEYLDKEFLPLDDDDGLLAGSPFISVGSRDAI